MKTIYTICVYYKDNRDNTYIDFEDKEMAEKMSKDISLYETVDFTDVLEFHCN